MTVSEFTKSLSLFLERKPFQPFSVTLLNGDCVTIREPKYLIHRDGIALYLDEGVKPAIIDSVATIEFREARA